MKNNTTIFVASILVLIIIIFAFVSFRKGEKPVTTANNPINAVSYMCNENKTIDASFYEGTTTPVVVPGQPPVPTGTAVVTLSDGRVMTLSQTLSADGVRFANPDESFVFWSKGNGALVLENNVEKSFIGCVKVVPEIGGLTAIYHNGTEGLSMRYPANYTVTDPYTYQLLGPGKNISGVKFTIPASLSSGTNLSSDTYISIEAIPQTTSCSASLFLEPGTKATVQSENGTDYSVASTTGAAAGNRYEETVYALPGTNPCVAVRYFIHYGNFDNYPTGSVQQFDREAILSQFDSIRRTLIVNQ